MKKYFLLYHLILALSLTIKAQQPSYYLLGKDELAGVDIYSIAQDSNSTIWLTTDKGLIKYDGYNYYYINNSKAKNSSLFGLTKDNNNNLFCCNLQGQIFNIKNDSLQLFYEIPDSLLANLVHFNFDNKNNLVFCTKNYYLVNKSSEIQFLFPSKYGSNKIAKTKKGELIFVDFLAQQIAYYQDEKITLKEQIDFNVSYPFITENEFYLARSYNAFVYYKNNAIWTPIDFENKKELRKNITEFNPINDSLLTFSFKNRGILFYNKNGTLKYQSSKLFPKYRISSILKDKENNLWLTTLGKGIIIIPNINIVDYNNHSLLKEEGLKTITSDNEGNIYTGGANGFIYKIKNQQVEIINKHNRGIDFLGYYDNLTLFKKMFFSLTKNKKFSIPYYYAKDVCFIDSTHFLTASSLGLHSSFFNKKTHLITSKHITKHRSYCVAYDKKRKEIWVGTTKGLQLISDTENKFVLHNNQQISVTDIEYINDEIWVSTSNKGVLIYKDGLFSRFFNATPHKIITALTYKNNKLYYTSNYGLHIYNFKNQSVKNITKTDGLLSNKIIDFEVVNNTIWVILPDGLQSINENKLLKNNIQPSIKWGKILINNESYLNLKNNEFNHQQNQFEFRFLATAFRHRGTLTYQYQLIGLSDTTWQETSYNNNSVKYASLSPGDYTFKVKAINENGIESETLSYSFSISPPFWLTWWFFTLCGLSLMLIVTSYFIIRLNIVRKRLTLEKQLRTSEITAIKAQMNPHFMFNALNSIQDLIMLKDVRGSNVYLGKFADLMRKTLEFSSKNFIALTDEIELLALYLELEKLRFGDDFTASINCKVESNKLQDLQIPSMLLQPYVENAIKHGLLHKKGQKELVINFCLNKESLTCEIIDNGVGRKKSAEIKQRREKTYPSFSTQANKKRIDLIKESTNQNISLTIIDLVENENAVGTKVIFKFN